ncbi:MAG TPA: spore maturation protein [Candidatus Merdivicinus intestinigallinarum]|nr:spore maturation protein [Candidatus Merdivicinus intestinigallinarum]
MSRLAELAVPLAVAGILLAGLLRKVNLLDAFAAGAKQGLKTAAGMVPPLVLFLVVLGMFEASGCLDALCWALKPLAGLLGIPQEVMPLALLRPLSGSGSLAVFQDILAQYGPDSLIGRTASIIQSASETTFYTTALYFGAAKVSRTRYALPCSLLGDLAVIASAGILARVLFS